MVVLIRMALAGAFSLVFLTTTYFGLTLSPNNQLKIPELRKSPATEGAPDITAVVLVAALKTRDVSSNGPPVVPGLKLIERFLCDESSLAPDGRETFLRSFALIALVEANQNGQFDSLIDRTAQRLKNAQWSPARACPQLNPRFGGTGYRRQAPPDLYHTSLAIEALRQAGVPVHDVYMQRALVFVSRCQNRPSKQAPFPSNARDEGGFLIAPASLAASQGKAKSDEAFRSCGSLTCAGIKSLVQCGATKEDPRIVEALRWLRVNYTLHANPGMDDPRCRLYDYYRSLAVAMTLSKIDVIVGADNVPHDWRRELVDVLRTEQQLDGSWCNARESSNPREAATLLTTSYALMAMHQILRPLSDEDPISDRLSPKKEKFLSHAKESY